MAKALFYRLFGVGKMPSHLSAELTAEGLEVSDEGLKSSVTYLNFRAPGKFDGWRRQWFVCAVGISKSRLVAVWPPNLIVNVPLTDERLCSMKFTVEKHDLPDALLCIAFDASLFQAAWSGTIEYRFETPLAQRFVDRLRAASSVAETGAAP